MGESVTLVVGGNGDAREARGYLAIPEGGAGPAVLVLHAWWGLNRFIERLCDRFAAEGFVALAPDMFDGSIATTIEGAERNVETADGPACVAVIDAAIDELLRHPAAASAAASVVGFSFGAYFALGTAVTRPDDVGAVVGFYGSSDHDFTPARSAFLLHFAENDPYEPAEWLRSMGERIAASGNPVSVHTYPGTGHWFMEDDRPDAYNPAAAQLAWQRTLAFLREPRSCE